MKQMFFLNTIAYSPIGAVFMNSFDISSKKQKTSLYLKNILSSVIENIGQTNVAQFITDNASNFESASDMILGKYPHIHKTKCAAHGIQLLLSDINKEVIWIQNIINDVRGIVAYIYMHSIVLSLMRQFTKNKELKCPCTTKFASNYLMLQSIFDENMNCGYWLHLLNGED